MGEVLPRGNHENGNESYLDDEAINERRRESGEKLAKDAAEAEKKNKENSIDAIHERLNEVSLSKAEMEASMAENTASESAVPLGGKHLGNHMVGRMQVKIRKQLSPSERLASKVIHQPVIETVSNAAGATVARPSGLLVGGIFSVISSLVVLYIARHYGYEYNFLIGIASFVGGFALGILLEGIFKLFRPHTS